MGRKDTQQRKNYCGEKNSAKGDAEMRGAVKYSVFIRYVADTMGNFENYYGHSAKRIMQNVSYKKALKHIMKNYKNIKSAEYLELYCETAKETIALFGYFNHRGGYKKAKHNSVSIYIKNKLVSFTAEQIRELYINASKEKDKIGCGKNV